LIVSLVPTITPSIASTTSIAPSQPRKAEHISPQKFGCPGVSKRLIKYDLSFESYKTSDIGEAFILIFLIYSYFLESV